MKEKLDKPFWRVAGILLGVAVLLAVLIAWGYSGKGSVWSGFGDFTTPAGEFVRGKTLWDWLELLVIPVFLGAGALLLNRSERAGERRSMETRSQLERELAAENQREAALQSYLDRMADLLLKEKLKDPENAEARDVARIRTLTVLRSLDPKRKGLVLIFLHESGLIDKDPVVNLFGADLSGADLAGTHLDHSCLRGAVLLGADLHSSILAGSDLRDANLGKADLGGAKLGGAVLSNADLSEADLFAAVLSEADLSWTQLWKTDFGVADLGKANLAGADLAHADLGRANLRGASLTGASLRAAYLREADLREADLGDARLDGADLRDADLRGTDLRVAELGLADVDPGGLSVPKRTPDPVAELGLAYVDPAQSRDGEAIWVILPRANLSGARYDGASKWPEGFDPAAAGAILQEGS